MLLDSSVESEQVAELPAEVQLLPLHSAIVALCEMWGLQYNTGRVCQCNP